VVNLLVTDKLATVSVPVTTRFPNVPVPVTERFPNVPVPVTTKFPNVPVPVTDKFPYVMLALLPLTVNDCQIGVAFALTLTLRVVLALSYHVCPGIGLTGPEV
jgi:hypothetical protein